MGPSITKHGQIYEVYGANSNGPEMGISKREGVKSICTSNNFRFFKIIKNLLLDIVIF